MELYIPTNDDDRLALLRQIANKAQQDAVNELFFISARSQERLAEFIERFASTLWRAREKRERQTQYIQEADAAIAALRSATLGVWAQLRWQLEWDEINAHGLEYYGLDRQGRQPRIAGRSGWLNIGHKILTGDETAKGQGYPGMEDSAQFTEAYNRAKEATDKLAATKLALSEATGHIAKLRRDSERVCRRAVAELRLALSAESETRRRDVLRAYGVQFVTSGPGAGAILVDPESNISFGESVQNTPSTGARSTAEAQSNLPPVSFVLPTPHASNGVKPDAHAQSAG
ncbi:MAG: hypothetical protein R2911_29335 [Caldilineaceae bacterium]